MQEDPRRRGPQSEARTFVIVLGGTAFMAALAVVLSFILRVPLAPQFRADFNDLLIGIIATLPLVVFLWWFSNTTLEKLASFRKSQIKFFAEIGFAFTPLRIALMAASAGVAEELLFRGVVQTWMTGFLPVVVAVIASNLLFGALHMRTALYAVIAGLVGIYMGVLYALTDNLLAPMITHALYDAAALEYTRRAIANWRTHSV